MALLPGLPTTLNTIDSHIEQTQSDWMREHCGASGIGNPCERAIYYSFRWTTKPEHSGRLLRLFRRGQDEEQVFIDDLRAIGLTVSEGPEPGKQWRFGDFGGHFAGSMDAAILGLIEAPKTWHVGEFKTANKKSFDDIVKNGVKKSKPLHFAQMQMYMHWSAMKRAVYIVTCKDNDRRYLERIEYNRYYAGELEEKAKRVIFAKTPPPKLSERPDYYLCKWCDHYEVCHQDGDPEVNCRTCSYSEPTLAGKWQCNRHNDLIQLSTQKTGCEDYFTRG